MSAKFRFFLILAPFWVLPFLATIFQEQNGQFFCLPESNFYFSVLATIATLGSTTGVPAFLSTLLVLLLPPLRTLVTRICVATLVFFLGLYAFPLYMAGGSLVLPPDGSYVVQSRCPQPQDATSPDNTEQNQSEPTDSQQPNDQNVDPGNASPAQSPPNAESTPENNPQSGSANAGANQETLDTSTYVPSFLSKLMYFFEQSSIFVPGSLLVAILTGVFAPRPRRVPDTLSDINFLDTREVLAQELQLLCGLDRDRLTSIYSCNLAAHEKSLSALCLSGGGIRSASFCLGVIQAFAEKGLLTKFHYLSTVSGGGYIASWLARWINDENHNADLVQQKLSGEAGRLIPNLSQIRALRENSNYLTPKLGLTSSDFWTAVVMSVRNITLNWLIFFPALLGVGTIFNLYYAFVRSSVECVGPPTPRITWGIDSLEGLETSCSFDFVSLIFLFVAIVACSISVNVFTHLYLPSDTERRLGSAQIKSRLVSLSLIYAFLFPVAVAPLVDIHLFRVVVFFCFWFLPVFGLAMTYFWACLFASKTLCQRLASAIETAAVTGIFTGGFIVLGIWLIHKIGNIEFRDLALATFGPLWAMWSLTLVSSFYVGFSRNDFRADADREWLARLSATQVSLPQIWAVLAVVCLILPRLALSFEWGIPTNIWPIVVVIISGSVAVFGGRGSFTPPMTDGPKRRRGLRALIDAAAAIFLGALLMLLSAFEQRLATGFAPSIGSLESAIAMLLGRQAPPLPPTHQLVVSHLLILAGLVYATWRMARLINVNRFSLHGMYRNRLVRAYLGGARTRRTPNPFTGFDPEDNVRMHSLRANTEDNSRAVLFPVINVALNLVRGDNPAWQERKAASFVITPLACGSSILSMNKGQSPEAVADGAFVDAKSYGGSEPDLEMTGQGISLGTAMTISGAATSPAMGYYSSAATSLLMTLFNVRLGAWLGNPALKDAESARRTGPDDALRPLLAEMFGLTNDKSTDIYLSDGGHFENLGLYEMVRRRCRFIFVVDAGQDSECKFDDLGNAIRKIFVDQNVQITFKGIDIVSRGQTKELSSIAIGSIAYPECKTPGVLVYLKPSYFAPEMPLDVRAYGEANSAFPHEPTTNQWFSESQLESYRRLGYFLTSRLASTEVARSMTVADFFNAIIRTEKSK